MWQIRLLIEWGSGFVTGSIYNDKKLSTTFPGT